VLELLNKIDSVFKKDLTYIFPLPTCGEKIYEKIYKARAERKNLFVECEVKFVGRVSVEVLVEARYVTLYGNEVVDTHDPIGRDLECSKTMGGLDRRAKAFPSHGDSINGQFPLRVK
jgi:hypothetical protein